MNPDETMIDDGLELDPMPGDELEPGAQSQAAPDPEPMPQDQELSPEDRRRLAESLILEDPELKDTYLKGLAASQAPQQAPQAQEPQQDPYQQLLGDPALEFLGEEIRALKAERDMAVAKAADAQAVQALIAETGAPADVARELSAVEGLGLAINGNPAFAALMKKAAKALSGDKAAAELASKSVAPPAYSAESSPVGDTAEIKKKMQNLKKSNRMYASWSDQELRDFVMDAEK